MTHLEEGVTLFNSQQFWHAHEAWEHDWLKSTGDEKQFLQALIQLAAAYHHVQRGTSPRGAVRLFDAALRRFDGVRALHEELDREDALAAARRHREWIAMGKSIGDSEYPKLRFRAS